jgi:hypothetical protein
VGTRDAMPCAKKGKDGVEASTDPFSPPFGVEVDALGLDLFEIIVAADIEEGYLRHDERVGPPTERPICGTDQRRD